MIVPDGKKNGSLTLVQLYDTELVNTIDRLKADGKQPFYGNTWLIDKEITDQTICVFDSRTKIYTDNRVYVGKKGAYIKKAGRKYYLEEFK